MRKSRDDDGQQSISVTTNIGSVTGQVHTGSGDILVRSFSASTISTKDEFLSALRTFKTELDAAKQHGLQEQVADHAVAEVEAIEAEVNKQNPIVDRIISGLEKTKSLIASGTSMATSLISAASIADKLVPGIEHAIRAAKMIFRE